jgi:phytoene synthase
MRTAAELDDWDPLFQEAARATAQGSKSFYFATRFFPAPLARAAHSVYWFCRFTDDLVDECEDADQARRDLDHWEAALRLALQTGRAEHQVLRLYLHTASHYQIPTQYAFELIEGMRMDLNRVRYRTFDELQVFCYRVASVVGLMMCSVIGLRAGADWEIARRHAISLGIAMQLTNILRDIGEDLRRDRIYLPAEDMQRFGYNEADLRAQVRNEPFRNLMRFEAQRARAFYAHGNLGIRMLNSRGGFAVKVASDVYAQILQTIERSGLNVFENRAVVPQGRKYWLTARNLALPLARHSAAKLAFWKT